MAEKNAAWANNFPDRSDQSFWGRWHKTKVLYVHDGDSFWMTKKSLRGEPIRIRLADWHAPDGAQGYPRSRHPSKPSSNSMISRRQAHTRVTHTRVRR